MRQSRSTGLPLGLIMRLAVLGVGVVFFVVCCGILGVVTVVGARIRAQRVAPFQPHLDEYAQRPKETAEDLENPHIQGKVLPLDPPERRVNYDVLIKLPPALSPQGPVEVGAVALLEWSKKKVGVYDKGGNAYIQVCHLTLVDKARNVIAGEEDFEGVPKVTTSSSGDDTGPRPIEEIVDYLSSLPRK
jgi:hypothetical protein